MLTFQAALGRTVENARRRRNWSQGELAKRLGTNQQHVSQIESGKLDVKTSTLTALAKAFDRTTSALCSEIEREQELLAGVTT